MKNSDGDAAQGLKNRPLLARFTGEPWRGRRMYQRQSGSVSSYRAGCERAKTFARSTLSARSRCSSPLSALFETRCILLRRARPSEFAHDRLSGLHDSHYFRCWDHAISIKPLAGANWNGSGSGGSRRRVAASSDVDAPIPLVLIEPFWLRPLYDGTTFP